MNKYRHKILYKNILNPINILYNFKLVPFNRIYIFSHRNIIKLKFHKSCISVNKITFSYKKILNIVWVDVNNTIIPLFRFKVLNLTLILFNLIAEVKTLIFSSREHLILQKISYAIQINQLIKITSKKKKRYICSLSFTYFSFTYNSLGHRVKKAAMIRIKTFCWPNEWSF